VLKSTSLYLRASLLMLCGISFALASPFFLSARAERALASLESSAEDIRENYRFTIRHKRQSKIQEVRDCIHLEVCSHRGDRYRAKPLDDGRNEVRTVFALTTAELDGLYRACPWKRFEAETVVEKIADDGTVLASLPSPDSDLSGAAYAYDEYARSRHPAILLPVTPEESRAAIARIRERIAAKDFDGAIREAMESYRMPLPKGFTIAYDPAMDTNAGATKADGETGVVTLGRNFFSEACGVVYGVRHELDHVAQHLHALKCWRQQRKAAFLDPYVKEEAAYLGDLLNLPSYCGDSWFWKDNAATMFETFRDHNPNRKY
jgi:hypothetical protein